MSSLGPTIGMAILGYLAGGILGKLSMRAFRMVVFVVLLILALELIGYHFSGLYWQSLREHAAAAAKSVHAPATHTWRLLTINLPLTAGVLLGLVQSIRGARRR
ncbi:MAG: hypothetical protein ABFE16_03085 [Armatimonadia bacterium]